MHKAEEIWLTISTAFLVTFLLIGGYLTFQLAMGPPSHMETIDPQKVEQTAPFDKPGIFKTGDNEYEVVMILETFNFTPNKIEIPAGAKVTFKMTSKDVVHGFEVAKTNINAMVMPGQIQKISHTFDQPGEYLVLCNEYCGGGHQYMSTTITVK